MSTLTIKQFTLPHRLGKTISKHAKDSGVSVQEYIIEILEEYEDRLQYESFTAAHPNGWERAEADEVQAIEALLASSL